MARKKRKTESQQARQFGVILFFLALAAAALFYWVGGHPFRAKVAVGVGVTALVLDLVAFPVWLAVFRVWMKFGHFMGTIMSAVILTIFFYLVFTPIGLLMRLLGKRPLDLAWKDGRSSYWIDKAETPCTIERYQRQF